MSFGGENIFGTPLSLGQFGYMAEAEGQDDLVDTPDARFNAALNEIKEELAWSRGSDVDVTSDVDNILMRHDIYPSELTKTQISRIQRAIA